MVVVRVVPVRVPMPNRIRFPFRVDLDPSKAVSVAHPRRLMHRVSPLIVAVDLVVGYQDHRHRQILNHKHSTRADGEVASLDRRQGLMHSHSRLIILSGDRLYL